MARQLRLDVDSDASGARRGLDATARAVDKVADQTRELGRSFVYAAGAAGRAASSIDRVGDQARTSAAEAKVLARALDDVGDQARQAGRAMDGIGSGGLAGKSLLTGLDSEAAKEGAQVATTFASAIEGGLMEAFKGLPPEAQAAIGGGIVAAIAVAAPAIGSAVSAALLLGVGGGGLAAGIALAANNANVQRAFSGLGEHLLVGLREAAKPFQAELVASANIFGKVFNDSLPDIKGIFATLSQAVQPLAAGLAGLVRSALPGIRRAAEAAVPLFRELARQMPQIGATLSRFFDQLALTGPGAVETFKQLLFVVQGLILVFGDWLVQMAAAAQLIGAINDALIPIGNTAHVLSGPLTGSLEDVGKSAEGAGRAVRKFKLDLDELFGRQMSAREAAIAYEQAIDDLAEGFKKGSGALDINNQKGRDNLTLVDASINAARQKLKADLDAAGGSKAAIDAANQAYQNEINRIRDVLRHLGLNEKEIDNLIGKANSIPRDVTIDVGLVGAAAAAGQLNSLAGAIGRVLGTGNVGVSASKSMQKRAGGGPVAAGEAYIVGEKRPEIFVPSVSGRILPDTSAMSRHAMAVSGASAPASSGNLIYNGTPTGLEALFLSWLEKKFRNGDLQLGT